MNHRSSSSPLATALRVAAATSGAVLGALALANAVIAARTPPLGFRLGGEFNRYPSRFGDLAYTVAGSGSPVLLLHGLDAGRSMAEWRAVFDDLSRFHTTYALDWQGWGLSDATREGYNATDFAEQIASFIEDVIGAPMAIIAAGQSGVFAALAARGGAPITQLVLVCPVAPAPDEPSGQSRAEALLQRAASGWILRAPVLGMAAINAHRSLARLRSWAREHAFFDKELAAREGHNWHVAAHQKGAQYGQRALLQGAFGCDWRAAWSGSERDGEFDGAPHSAPGEETGDFTFAAAPGGAPTEPGALLVWGRNALREGYAAAPEWLALRPGARLEVIENALLFPHFEQPERFLATVLPVLGATSERN